MPISRKHIAAFKDELNWIASGAIIAAAAYLGEPALIPFVWLGYEAAYMLFVPDSAWYERRLRGKLRAAEVRRRQALRRRCFPAMLPEDRRRFQQLERARREIEAQQDGAGMVQQEMLARLDYLLERFLQFASKRGEYLEYLRRLMKQETGIIASRRGWWGRREETADDRQGDAMIGHLLRHYRDEIEQRKRELESERGRPGEPILQKNIQILEQSQTNIVQIGEILRNVTQQLELVFDTFTLIGGHVRMRPPEQMLHDVEEVVGSSKALTEALRELAPLEQAVQRLGRHG